MRELFYYQTLPYSRKALFNRVWRGILYPTKGSGFVAYTRGHTWHAGCGKPGFSASPPVFEAGWYYREQKNLYRFHGPFPSRYAAMIAFLLHTD